MKNEALEGIWLPGVTEAEAKEIYDAVREGEYGEGGVGVKALLLDLLRVDMDRDAESPLEKLEAYIKQNPEKVMGALVAGGSLFNLAKSFLNKKTAAK